jgi:hypothetical protein
VSSDTWDFLRDKKPDVDWWHLFWYPHVIPKHAFALWLAVQNRLTTGNQILVWSFRDETLCGFCKHGVESRDHLFFFLSVVLALVFGTHVFKDVLVWPILLFGKMC